MSHSKWWDKVQELVECVNEGEVDKDEHIEFIMSLFDNLDPHNPEEELSEKQLKWLDYLWGKYCNDGDCEEW
jgi:hypothetical protein